MDRNPGERSVSACCCVLCVVCRRFGFVPLTQGGSRAQVGFWRHGFLATRLLAFCVTTTHRCTVLFGLLQCSLFVTHIAENSTHFLRHNCQENPIDNCPRRKVRTTIARKIRTTIARKIRTTIALKENPNDNCPRFVRKLPRIQPYCTGKKNLYNVKYTQPPWIRPRHKTHQNSSQTAPCPNPT